MRKSIILVLLFSLVAPMAGAAISLSPVNHQYFDGIYVERSRLFYLESAPATGASQTQRLKASAATSAYQATGNGYRIVAVRCGSFSGAIQVIYGDNDVGSDSSLSTPTNVVYFGGASTGPATIFDTSANPRSNAWLLYYKTVPTSKYAYTYGSGSSPGSCIFACEQL